MTERTRFTEHLETMRLIRYALAIFKFRKNLSGFKDLSAYLAALIFYKIAIKRWIHKELTTFRNKVMHDGPKTVTEDEIEAALRAICHIANLNYEQEMNNVDFEDILSFGERGISYEEIVKLKRYPIHIVDSDFDEFYNLYKKARALAYQLQEEIGPSIGLILEEISEFVPTTGGIWLPWVTRKVPPRRAHMSRATLGVTFTPTNIRIGLDFGSRAHQFKMKYYELLVKRKLNEELRRLRLSDKGYAFYDTFWYYNIRNPRPIEWYFKGEAIQNMREIRSALEEVKILNGKPMTSNKLLIGKIIYRDSQEFPKALETLFKEVCDTFNEMHPILTKIES